MFAHMYVNSLFSIPSEGCVSTATLQGLVFPFVSIVGVPKTNVKHSTVPLMNKKDQFMIDLPRVALCHCKLCLFPSSPD